MGDVNVSRFPQNLKVGLPTIPAVLRSIVLAMVARTFMSCWKKLRSILRTN